LFAIADLDAQCEDYGQAVIYKGTIPGHPERFDFDGHHTLETGRVSSVCGNTWRMLGQTRFEPHFTFIGSVDRHYGLFPGCGTAMPFATADTALAAPVSAGACNRETDRRDQAGPHDAFAAVKSRL
jgi:arsenite methyltransferase